MSKAPDSVQTAAEAASNSFVSNRHHTAISRRELLGLGAAMAVSQILPAEAAQDDGLNARAARRGMLFGCAVQQRFLRASPQLRAAIARDCGVIVPENEMKWGYTERRRGKPNYRDAEAIADFAAGHGMKLRGHTAMWYLNRPSWTNAALGAADGRSVALKRVSDIVGHFRGRVFEWDVVNEMVEPRDGLSDGTRNFPPFAPGDIAFIADCFHAAREADPAAKLVYNDFGLEYKSSGENRRRTACLGIVERLKARNVPIDGFGIQCHLNVGNNFDSGLFRSFLAEIAATGVEISLTEFDIGDRRLPSDAAERDRLVAEHASEFLSVAFDEKAVSKLLTWGFVDRQSWLNAREPRADGLPKRPLPLDDQLQRKPLWHAIARSFDNAPLRS